MTTIYNFQFPKYGKLKLLSTWEKGKKDKTLRFLMEVVEDNEFYKKGDKFLLWVEEKGFPIAGSNEISISENISDDNYKNEKHIKNRVYNYYKLDIKNKEEVFQRSIKEWLNNKSNLFPSTLNSYAHVEKSKINYIPVTWDT